MSHTLNRSRQGGHRTERIEGGFVKLTAHQLVLALWLFRAGRISKRALRVWFAAAEMLERRRHTCPQTGPERPLFSTQELSRLVGGRGTPSALADLRADVKRLAELRLVTIEPHAIRFAVSVDEIALEDVSGFWEMFDQIPNKRRAVPVPRRTLRALAGGFSNAVTTLMIALLLRGVFWQREQGDFRIDHRSKLSEISAIFGISRRPLTEARAKLIELGWLEPLPTRQWELNRFGLHDRINVDWTPSVARSDQGESATPEAEIPGGSASLLNRSASLTRTPKNTRRLRARAPDPAGVSTKTGKGKRRRRTSGPDIRDIRAEHLEQTEDLLELHRQAVAAKLIDGSEGGRLDFLALAERARTRGNRPGALLAYLLRERRFEFISQADEDAARDRLRQLRDGPCRRDSAAGQGRGVASSSPDELSQEERFIVACVRIANQHRIEPFLVAREAKGWDQPRWEQAYDAYQQSQFERHSASWSECG